MGDKKMAHDCISTACEIYTKHLGPEHPSTRDVLEVLKHLNKVLLGPRVGVRVRVRVIFEVLEHLNKVLLGPGLARGCGYGCG